MMRGKVAQSKTSLLKTFLICMAVIALTYAVLALGIWILTNQVLEREEAFVEEQFPQLDSAFQLTAATAGLQSQGFLLISANSEAELQRRQQQLSQVISSTRQTLERMQSREPQDHVALDTDLSKFSAVTDDLSSQRVQQIALQRRIQMHKEQLLADMDSLRQTLQRQVAHLTELLVAESDSMLQLAIQQRAQTALPDQLSQNINDYEAINLEIQDYLILGQDLVALGAIVERIPLLTNDIVVDSAKQRRDLLTRALVGRAIYLRDESNKADLLTQLRALRTRLRDEDGVFESQSRVLSLGADLEKLNLHAQGYINGILEQSDRLRNRTRSTVNTQALLTLQDLSSYRVFVLWLFAGAVFILAFVSYWLIYRKTVIPLVEVSRQLEDVGSDRFQPVKKPYAFKELATLSHAIVQLDTAQKDMRLQEVQLQASYKDLKQANEELEQFAHIASHDLQEPLRKLQQFSDLLEEDYLDKLDDDGQYFINVIRTSARRMSVLIKETLAYSRSGSSNQLLEAIDLGEIVTELLDEMDIAIEEAQANITIDCLPSVQANRTGMDQLFRNLILNALKYRKPDTPAEVQISCKSVEDGLERRLLVQIQDNGIGVSERHLERIFRPFERLQSGDVKGTGLGLAICKKVVESHNWTLQVRSTVDVGTVFEISIPQRFVLSVDQF